MTENNDILAKLVIVIPTFNEVENVREVARRIRLVSGDCSILFVDDNSPDGTGKLLDEMAALDEKLNVLHRPEKRGLGVAHLAGLRWAYEQKFSYAMTSDADLTHDPADIPKFVALAGQADVVVGSRFLAKDSLKGWNLYRKFLTIFGHAVTRIVFGNPNDMTGAFRLYNLNRIPLAIFEMVQARGYSFLLESLFLIMHNGFSVLQVPILLPPRTYGHSKMSANQITKSVRSLIYFYFARRFYPERFRLPTTQPIERHSQDADESPEWNNYWQSKSSVTHSSYEIIAAIYRRYVIRPNLNSVFKKFVPRPGSKLLHAGCGSGQVDEDIARKHEITAMDISAPALTLYANSRRPSRKLLQASIFDIPEPDAYFDCVYNLGVMEHFFESDIDKALNEFRRVLKPDGSLILFWPHRRSLSVHVLHVAVKLLERLEAKRFQKLFPDEVTYITSKEFSQTLLARNGFDLISYYFGPRDLFAQAMLVAKKSAERPSQFK